MHSLRRRVPPLRLAAAVAAALVVSCATFVAGAASAPTSLSGTWKGTYSGTFHGTFTLHWVQSRSRLSGTIDLSTAGRSPIKGGVSGSKINFGTVGSTVITYKGTVSGKTMSGTYHTPAGGGTWRAHKT